MPSRRILFCTAAAIAASAQVSASNAMTREDAHTTIGHMRAAFEDVVDHRRRIDNTVLPPVANPENRPTCYTIRDSFVIVQSIGRNEPHMRTSLHYVKQVIAREENGRLVPVTESPSDHYPDIGAFLAAYPDGIMPHTGPVAHTQRYTIGCAASRDALANTAVTLNGLAVEAYRAEALDRLERARRTLHGPTPGRTP